jgi:hypothetical protein
MPTYDPARDGCPFAWIVRQAQMIRQHRQDKHAELVEALRKRIGLP